jgi:hypothetical protein
MNLKHVVHLIRVDSKSGRLIRSQRLTRYVEKRTITYLLYGGALAIGLTIGALAGWFYNSALSGLVQGIFFSLPTLVLIYSLIFTLLQQIQRMGVRFSSQAPYWLPITWQEHTLASIFANLLGFTLASLLGIAAAIIVFSLFIGQVLSGLGVVLAVLAAAFMASASTEVLRILQSRFIGAVYKSTGRAAVWVRFAGSLLFFILFYIFYFYITQGSNALTFIQTVAQSQSAVWFVPFVWLGMTLYSFMNGLALQGFAFSVFSVLFILGLFYLATGLNKRFGLYEPPAITISRGAYAPKTGFLGRFGFSTVEAALIRKDLKAFTRRRELMTVFIIPVVILIVPLMQSVGTSAGPATPIYSALVFLMPPSLMAMSLGSFIVGEEGQAMWRIYASPIAPRSLVRSKYFFILFFSILVLVITNVIGFVIFHPPLKTVVAMSLTAVFLVFALGAVSLSNGIRGADFTEAPRARMIRQTWSFINLAACLLAAVAVLAPFFPYLISTFTAISIGTFADLYLGVVVSAIIAAVITGVFIRIALNNAKELIAKAEI